MHLKTFAIWWPFCFSLSVLTLKVPGEIIDHFELYYSINENLFEITNGCRNFLKILSDCSTNDKVDVSL